MTTPTEKPLPFNEVCPSCDDVLEEGTYERCADCNKYTHKRWDCSFLISTAPADTCHQVRCGPCSENFLPNLILGDTKDFELSPEDQEYEEIQDRLMQLQRRVIDMP